MATPLSPVWATNQVSPIRGDPKSGGSRVRPFVSIYSRFLAPARQPRSSATLARMSLSTSVGLRPRLRPP
ncbi:hypothetical protein TNCT_213841 [Trichonephila clavata]|uniref:Uncharacterized protein n=1 Tax=Trichonephila clavata TaxID=2740835 RepID=A0A8X6KMX7_TRICU|nr:hypothetical protein TNCT_213841 [Trichonephila clavata]